MASIDTVAMAWVASRPGIPTMPPRDDALLLSLDTIRQDVAGASGRRPRHRPEMEVGCRQPARPAVSIDMRARLESLGDVQAASAPAFPEPDVVLPPPGG